MFSASKRVMTRRTSSPVKVSSAVTFPERKPLASGLNGTNPIPSSAQAGRTSASNIRSMIEYSLWIAVSGVTAWARRIWSSVAWDMPQPPIFPSSMSSPMTAAMSSTGVVSGTRWR